MVKWRGDIIPDPRRELEITTRKRRPHWTDDLRGLLPELPWNNNESNGNGGLQGVDYRSVIWIRLRRLRERSGWRNWRGRRRVLWRLF